MGDRSKNLSFAQKIGRTMGKVHSPPIISGILFCLKHSDHSVADLVHTGNDTVAAVVEDGGIRVMVDGDELLN